MKIERSKQAMHMTSRLEGQRLPMLHAVDVLAAMMPTFTSINIPEGQIKEKTAQTADVFGGAIGFIGFNGHLDFSLTGKSIVVENERLHTQSTVMVTKYANVGSVLTQVTAEQQLFLQHLENESEAK